MFKKTFEYKDYNGNDRKDTLMFNFTEAELMEMDFEKQGGLINYINRISETQDGPALAEIFKDILLRAYGAKSDDGKRFIKNAQLKEEFEQSIPYSMYYTELARNSKAAAEFMNEVMPDHLKAKLAEAQKANHPALNK